MRWLPATLAAAAVVGVLAVGGCFVFGASAQAEGRLEGGRIVRSIAESWNSEILLTRFTPEVRATTDPGELRKFVGVLRDRLGVLKVLGSARTDGWQVVFGIQGIAVWTAYHMDSEFEHGRATVALQLVKRGGTWHVLQFHINSPLLAPEPRPAK